jgi:hypothetical protein
MATSDTKPAADDRADHAAIAVFLPGGSSNRAERPLPADIAIRVGAIEPDVQGTTAHTPVPLLVSRLPMVGQANAEGELC